MNRQEFTKILSEYRKQSSVSTKELCFKLQCMPSDLYKFENAKHNYNLQKCFDYLDAIGVCMAIKAVSNQSVIIRDYPTLLHFVINERLVLGYTQRSLCSVIKRSHTAIAHVETQKSIMTIDTLLKIADTLNFTINILPIPPTPKEL